MTRGQFIENVSAEQEGLRRFLLVLCSGDKAKADDIAQNALIKAYVASGDYSPRAKFSTWLFKIAYNCFIDSVRKKSLDVVCDESEVENTVPDSAASDAAFEHENLYAAIDALPPNERASILLFYMEDRPIKEISAILNLPEGTVKSHLSRGREHIKNRLIR